MKREFDSLRTRQRKSRINALHCPGHKTTRSQRTQNRKGKVPVATEQSDRLELCPIERRGRQCTGRAAFLPLIFMTTEIPTLRVKSRKEGGDRNETERAFVNSRKSSLT